MGACSKLKLLHCLVVFRHVGHTGWLASVRKVGGYACSLLIARRNDCCAYGRGIVCLGIRDIVWTQQSTALYSLSIIMSNLFTYILLSYAILTNMDFDMQLLLFTIPLRTHTESARFEDIGHSDEAMSDMKKYEIGTVDGYDPETYKSSGSSGGGGGGGMMNIILILLLLAAAGFAYTQMGSENGTEL